jgi:predicted amidohydrolase
MMKTGFIQYAISKNRNDNIRRAGDLIQGLDADIIVLPELCDCGYVFNDKEELLLAARPIDDNGFIEALKAISVEKSCCIIAGVAERSRDQVYNSAVILDQGKLEGIYRKMHLTDYERALFRRGETNAVFSVRGIRIGVQICFDLWFPEVSREQLLFGAELFCAPANFGGETTCDVARIRALENLTPLVLCNRIGSERNDEIEADFLGRSAVIDGNGGRIIEAEARAESAQSCVIEPTHQKANAICCDFMAEIKRHHTR